MIRPAKKVSFYSIANPSTLGWDYTLNSRDPDPGGTTLYLLDWGPLAFLAMSRLERMGSRAEGAYATWLGYQFNGGLLRTLDPYWDWDKARFLLLGDRKPYWRSRYCPGYKSGRTAKPQAYNPLSDTAASWASDNGLPLARAYGYEADDMAGQIVREFRLGKHPGVSRIVLHTVDTDWLQLVGGGVSWINTSKQQPYYRDAPEAIAYARDRLGGEISEPWEIATLKCQHGDPSDSLYLPEDGSPVPSYLISLYDVPLAHSEPLGDTTELIKLARKPDPAQAKAAYWVLLAEGVWLGV